MASLLESSPLRLVINGADYSAIVDEGLTWSNVDGGGFEACSLSIAQNCPELSVGNSIRIESGLQTAWEGRIGMIQRSLGPKTAITGEGYGALLKDRVITMVYVDRDLTRWTQPSLQRQINLVLNSNQLKPFQAGTDPLGQTNQGLVMQIADSWAAPWTPTSEAWYDAGPENTVQKVYYNLKLDPGVGGVYTEKVRLSDDDVQTNVEVSADLNPSAPTSGYFNPGTPYRFAVLNHSWPGTPPGGVQGAQRNAYFQRPACYGPHGLTGRGSDPVGFYPSDIVGHVISDAQTLGMSITAGIIPDYTAYTVRHYVQYVPVPHEQVIADMAALAGVHWGTWESLTPLTSPVPRFDFRPYPTSPTCFCLRRDCDELDINEDLSGLYNVAQVTFTDVAGVQQAVRVTLDNPYLDAIGLTRTVTVDAGTNTTSGATTFGTLLLALLQLQARVSGQMTMSAMVQTPAGAQPAWMLRAGLDRLRVIDMPGQSAFSTINQSGASDFIITRVETNVSADGISTSVELGQGASLLEVLQARLQTASVLANVL